MNDILIIEKAIEELECKNFAVTEQFLNIHQVVYENGKPKIARLDTESEDGTAIVYFPVKDEAFFFAIYLDTEPEISVRWANTENYNSVCFCAHSEKLNLEQLLQMTTLKSTEGRNKGEPRGKSKAVWKESTLFFEPNPEADEFEDKLKKLLDYLEQDKAGVAQLVAEASGYIRVVIEFHNGNSMLGGLHIDVEDLKRMAVLHLEIDFDLYVGGNLFLEDC